MSSITVPLEIAGDALNNNSKILTNGTLSSDNVILRIPLTSLFGVTAYVTNVGFTDVKSGAPIFTGGGAGEIWSATNDQTYPQTISLNKTGGTSSSGITISVSAFGNPCAVDEQKLVYLVSLSSKALSGNGTGFGVVVDVDNTLDSSLTTRLSATNVSFANRTCEAEYRRLRQMEAC